MEVSLLMLITLLSHILTVGLSILSTRNISLIKEINLIQDQELKTFFFCHSFNLFKVRLSISKMLETVSLFYGKFRVSHVSSQNE